MQQKILVVRFGSLGDVILTSATVLNLRLNFPDCHLVYLTKERFESTVRSFDGVDEIITLPDAAGALDYWRLLNQLDQRNFDTIIDLHGNMRSWLARKVITANDTYVYPKRRLERQAIVRRRNKRIPETWPHTIDLYNDCIRQMKAKIICRRPMLHPLEISCMPSELYDYTVKKVVIAPGAAHPNKQWGQENFVEVALRLHDLTCCHVIWAGTSGDKPTTEVRQLLSKVNLVELEDCLIDHLAYIIAQADLTISNDSGLMHLSSAVGTPVISIFGATHPALGFAPRGLFDKIIEIDESCRPCSLHGKKTCFRDERYCFNRISPDAVVSAATSLLEKQDRLWPALFVDRDGTIIVEKHYLSDPDQVELIDGVPEALKLAADKGFKIVIVSNQSGIARGYFTVEQAELVNARMLELLSAAGVKIDGVYFCPYFPGGAIREYAVDSDLRKPRPGMAEQAADDLGLDLRKSIVIGDKIDDLYLGKAIGAKSFLVRTGHGQEEENKLRRMSCLQRDIVFDDLLSAVSHVRW